MDIEDKPQEQEEPIIGEQEVEEQEETTTGEQEAEEQEKQGLDLAVYEKEYSEDGYWAKLKKYAATAGIKVTYSTLKLFYCSKSKGVPVWAKSLIIGALGYFILPIDVIPDIIPVTGFLDDAGILASALTAIARYVTPEIKEEAKQKLSEWYGEDAINRLKE